MSRFINPFTDWGFKFIFGREVEKAILIDFLNDLLAGEHVITDLSFINTEQIPDRQEERKAIYDIHCETATGERIIVEMQNREQPYFRDRGLYYLSRAVVNQAPTGKWDYCLNAVYGVFFVNFLLSKEEKEGFRTDVVLADRDTGKVFNSKFRQIYLELPRFRKDESECETDFERWIYVLKNMETLDRMPFKARKAVFDRLEQIASVGNLTAEQRDQYETEWKIYNDYYNTLDFAEEKGRKEGMAEGLQKGMEKGVFQTALNMKKYGAPMDFIIKCTGLSQEEIETLS